MSLDVKCGMFVLLHHAVSWMVVDGSSPLPRAAVSHLERCLLTGLRSSLIQRLFRQLGAGKLPNASPGGHSRPVLDTNLLAKASKKDKCQG